jgi:hypothetical protein
MTRRRGSKYDLDTIKDSVSLDIQYDVKVVRVGWARKTINRQIDRIKRCFVLGVA